MSFLPLYQSPGLQTLSTDRISLSSNPWLTALFTTLAHPPLTIFCHRKRVVLPMNIPHFYTWAIWYAITSACYYFPLFSLWQISIHTYTPRPNVTFFKFYFIFIVDITTDVAIPPPHRLWLPLHIDPAIPFFWPFPHCCVHGLCIYALCLFSSPFFIFFC